MLFRSGTGTPLAINFQRGVCLDLTFDIVTTTGIMIPSVFITRIDTQGRAPFPAIPDLTALLGMPITYQGISFDLGAGAWVMTTDPGQF